MAIIPYNKIMSWEKTPHGYDALTTKGRALLSKSGKRWVLTLGDRTADLGRRASFDGAESKLSEWGAVISTVAEISELFNETLDYYRRSWGTDGKARAAKLVVDALEAYPILNDQIPNDLKRLAIRDAADA